MSSRRRNRPPTGQERTRGRGRHRKATSPETRRWEETELVPERPAWMPEDTYHALYRLRGEL